MRKNETKIFSVAVIIGLFINLSFPAITLAYSFSVPYGALTIDSSQMVSMANELMQNTESRYGFTSDILRTADRKYSAPVAELSFDNTNPKPGEKVTAYALPEFFKNDPQNLYYTWYIIHTKNGKPETATNTIREGKIEAAKIMAHGDYDPELDGQDYAGQDKDPDNDGWPDVDSNSYDADKDQAPMGGSDGKGGLTEDSDNFDASLSEYCGSEPAPSSCNLYTEKSAFESYYQLQSSQNNSYCSSCAADTLSWGTLSSDNQCCYLVLNPTDTGYSGYDSGTDYCPSSYNQNYESCFGYTALQSTNESVIQSCLDTYYSVCSTEYDSLHTSTNFSTGSNDTDYSRCFRHSFGVSNDAYGFQGYSGSSNSYDNDTSGLDYNIACKHKWVNAKGYTSGSGKFTTGEEEYWKTDPTDPDTDGDGFSDGADVIGLGQQDFTWTYRSGDRVGVVIEGTSMLPTDEENAYYKIMWGYLGVCDSTKAGLMSNDECDSSDDYGFGYLATQAPGEEGDAKLQLSLAYSPDDPIADPSNANADNISGDGSISNADKITVNSSLDNTDLDPGNLYYAWYIQKGDLEDEDSWKKMDIADNFDTDTVSSGLGLSSFSFTPKTSAMSGNDDLQYFKVTVTASRSSGTASKRGRASVVIPVNKKGIRLQFFQVDTASGKATLGKEVCNGATYCPVVKNQLLAAKVSSSGYDVSGSEFSWNINGTDYPTPSDPSDLFSGWDDATTFFGIVENAGETLDITVKATPKDALEPVAGTRQLIVVDPSAYIFSTNPNSRPTTYSVDDENTRDLSYELSSSHVFEADTGSDVAYTVGLSPDYLFSGSENAEIDWKINGTSIADSDFDPETFGISDVATDDSGKTLAFKTGDAEGASYTIEADVKRYWSADEKNILGTAWDITPSTLLASSSIDITTVAAPLDAEDATSLGHPGQILAAISTHLPHYFMYLLRLVITVSVMFIMSAGFYGLSQSLGFKNDED
ncbi:MAG: hypothetical protein PHF35_01510 [Candidatus Moranbacteria bacterium]|nr:hypothetical protein [Candidatus Moranbacteria bacterium]